MSIVDNFVASLDSTQSTDLEKLLSLILAKARRHSVAEAGSIFVVEPCLDAEHSEGEKRLRAYSLQNDRMEVKNEQFTIELNPKSIAGYVATMGEVVEVDDLYALSSDLPYRFNRTYDDKEGYRSTSMLAFPLKNFYGEVIGVVQLLNHIHGTDGAGNPTYAPFPLRCVDDMKSVMHVLGSMIERVHLLRRIEELEEAVKALSPEKEQEAQEATA